MLKITRPSYVVTETSKEQKAVLNILTDLGYRWKTKAMEHIPIENNERLVVLNIYPNKHLITAVTSFISRIWKP